MYATDISKILEKNILLMNFLPVKEIIAYISEAYNKYIEDIKTAENQNLINVQNLINNDLEVIKNIALAERNFMKYFIIFDYFKHNSFIMSAHMSDTSQKTRSASGSVGSRRQPK